MGQALGTVLPLAVAIFPIPIIAVVLVVGSERGSAKGLAFVLAWFAGLAAIGAVVLLLRGWMARHNAAIMTVLLLLIGAKLIGDAVSGFSS